MEMKQYIILLLLIIFSSCAPTINREHQNNETLLIESLNESCNMRDLNFKITLNNEKYLAFKCENTFRFETYRISKTSYRMIIIDDITK